MATGAANRTWRVRVSTHPAFGGRSGVETPRPSTFFPRSLSGEAMCDFPEEELAEYLLWLEAARARAATVPARTRPGAPSELRSVPERAEPAVAEA
jgi:hypothetical protein